MEILDADTSTLDEERPSYLWRKGQSGNPTGRSKHEREVNELARSYGKQAIQRLADIMLNAESHPIAVIRAAEVLLNRGFGKPKESVEVMGAVQVLPVDGPPSETYEQWMERVQRERQMVIEQPVIEVTKCG